jgi:hypothetical protein
MAAVAAEGTAAVAAPVASVTVPLRRDSQEDPLSDKAVRSGRGIYRCC